MSRHVIRDDEKYEVIVGWDPPLATYFIQVFDKARASGDDEGLAVWEGGMPDAIRDLHKFKALCEPYAPLTPEMVTALAKDRDESHDPSPTQVAGLKLAQAIIENRR